MEEPRRPQPSAEASIAAGPQPEAAATPEAPPAAGRVFDPELRALVAAVLDRLIPARDDLPAAGALGVGSFLERSLAGDPALRRLVLDGLRAVDVAAGAPFASLGGEQQDTALRHVEAAHPAFFAALVNHTYRGYYTDKNVLTRLERSTGYANRPPQPLGHTLLSWDPESLAKQRDRAPFWRRTG